MFSAFNEKMIFNFIIKVTFIYSNKITVGMFKIYTIYLCWLDRFLLDVSQVVSVLNFYMNYALPSSSLIVCSG